jgi:hypothetical protein
MTKNGPREILRKAVHQYVAERGPPEESIVYFGDVTYTGWEILAAIDDPENPIGSKILALQYIGMKIGDILLRPTPEA